MTGGEARYMGADAAGCEVWGGGDWEERSPRCFSSVIQEAR